MQVLNFLRTLWAKRQLSRGFCPYCAELPVEIPGTYCSEDCRGDAEMEARAA